MISLSKVLTLLLLINSAVGGSPSSLQSQQVMKTDNRDSINTEVLDVTRQLTKFMIAKDLVGLNRILDKNFTLTHITGSVQSKEEWFAEIESERMKYYSYIEVKTTVKLNGDTANFVGQNILDARIWGSRNNWRLQQTMQLHKRNGKWIILKSVASAF
jgi:hypothetical protein